MVYKKKSTTNNTTFKDIDRKYSNTYLEKRFLILRSYKIAYLDALKKNDKNIQEFYLKRILGNI